MKLIIYTDGGARGNPGKAASAFIIQDTKGHILHQEGLYLGRTTNNQAEYQAVKAALIKAQSLYSANCVEIEIRADSLLIVKQLQGEYKVKNAGLKDYYQNIKKLEEIFQKVSYQYIPREENLLADKLVNQTLDSQKY